jgi:hypothetical protein
MTVTTDDNEASIHSSDSSREIGDLQHVAGGQVDSTIALQRNDGFDDDSAALANLSARRRKLARELAAQYLEEEAQYLEEEEKIPTSLINERLSTSVTPSATVNPASTLVPEVQTCDPVTVQMKAELKLQDDEDSKDIGTTDEEDGIDDEEKCMPSSTHEIEDGSSPFSNQAGPRCRHTTLFRCETSYAWLSHGVVVIFRVVLRLVRHDTAVERDWTLAGPFAKGDLDVFGSRSIVISRHTHVYGPAERQVWCTLGHGYNTCRGSDSNGPRWIGE